MKRVAIASALFSLLYALPASATTYTGCLSAGAAQLGCTAGLTAQDGYSDFSIDWSITDSGTNWVYTYTLSNLFTPQQSAKAVDTFLLEVSSGFDVSTDLSNVTGASYSAPATYAYDPGTNYKGIPDGYPIYALRFTAPTPTTSTFTISFTSTKAPVWGDFFSSLSTDGGANVYNSGFTFGDPSVAAANGTVSGVGATSGAYKILRPDTAGGSDTGGLTTVPEPASLILLGTGLLAARRIRRRK